MRETFRREAEIFIVARKMPARDRALYLDGACAGDAPLRQRVDELLQANDLAAKSLQEVPSGAQETSITAESPDPGVIRREPAGSLDQAGATIDRYRLMEKIGEGGFGVVYVAEQKEPVRRRVALKIIKLGMDTRAVVARFAAEQQALAMMDHPNIARVLDAGATSTGRPFFVMDLVKGVRLTDYCDQHKVPTPERLDLFIQVCRAIQHAHQKGIIHRDIKPSNILVTLHDGVPVPKVIDFGIAKATQGDLTDQTVYTQFHQFIGTPAYMSPEQAERSGLDIDTRSDIYSLGVLLYELLTGRTPFDPKELLASGMDSMRRTIREKEPVSPSGCLATLTADELTTTARQRSAETSKLLHQVKGDLDWIVMKCLEKDRTRRYETANGLAMDLQRHLKNEPVLARPPSAVYKLQKSWRRNKLVFAAAALIALALLMGITVSSWQAIEASKARNAEQQQRVAAQIERDKAHAARQAAEAARQAEKQQRVRAETREAEASHNLYVADMNLAQQAWEQNSFDRLRELLRGTETSPDRGFEWYYWQRQSHLDLRTLRGHLDEVTCVTFSPDGRRLITASADATAKLWDATSGREIFTLTAHLAPVLGAAFSPDGRLVATASADQTVKVWGADKGQELLTLRGHHGPIRSVAFSPDSREIVTGSEDRTAKVWDAASGRELATLQGHQSAIYSVAFSPHGRQIVTGSDDRTARLWESDTGRQLQAFQGHSDRIYAAGFAPDGRRIVTAGRDRTAKVWDAATGQELLTLRGHGDWVHSAAFSPDGRVIATGSYDHTARVWEAATGRQLGTLKGHRSLVTSLAFSPDGRWLATGSADHTARIWEWENAVGQERLTFTGHLAGVNSVAFSPDGKRVISGGDPVARVWDTAGGQELLTLTGHQGPIFAVAISPDGLRLATGSDDKTAKVWDAADGRELLTLRGHSSSIGSVAFSPDSRQLVTSSGDNTAIVWDLTRGKQLLRFNGHRDRLRSVALSSDGRKAVTGGDDGTPKVWDVVDGRELLTLKGHTSSVNAVVFSADGQRIVTGTSDQTAQVWDTATGRELLTLSGHRGPVWAVAFSPDGKRIVTGSRDQTVKLWDAADGRELLTLKGHRGDINSVAFSPDGRRIVTGSEDRTAKLWEAARVEQVAAWAEQERAAAQYLAALQRERAAEQERRRLTLSREEGAIKRWLILAPIPLGRSQSGTEGLDLEQIQNEGRLQPRAGESKPIGGEILKWQLAVLEDNVIDFNAILGVEMPHSVAYAVCYLRSAAEQHALQMLVGSDDQSKIYLNGQEIYKSPFPRSFIAEQDRVPKVSLRVGLNVLVFKVVNETRYWKGSIRLTDSMGNPVTGIRVTLNPDDKD